MLIFPIENKPNWRKPPIVTIAFIVLNVAVFLFYQTNDSVKTQRALNHYIQSDLIEYEYDLTMAYLLKNRPELFNYLQTIQSEYEYQAYFALLVFSLPEIDEIVAEQSIGLEREEWPWLSARHTFEEFRGEVSNYKFGLVPAQARWFNFISYAFLHGGWEHLIGNMIFLFLFGFLLELKLGRLLYVIVYGISGAFAGLLFQLLNNDSLVPLVGASGAVSGLMGAYIVLYGMQKIRFFYCIGFYFGETKAPAAFVLPLWIAKEVYGFYFLNDQVAYTAHLGGLLVGASMLACIRPFVKKHDDEGLRQAQRTENQQLESILNTISRYSANLDVNGGIAFCRKALKDFPSNVDLLSAYFSIAKLQVNGKEFHEVTFDVLRRLLAVKTDVSQSRALIRRVLGDYSTLSPRQIVTQHDALMARVAHYLILHADQEDGIRVIENFRRISQLSEKWEPAISAAVNYCRTMKKHKHALALNNMLPELQQR